MFIYEIVQVMFYFSTEQVSFLIFIHPIKSWDFVKIELSKQKQQTCTVKDDKKTSSFMCINGD